MKTPECAAVIVAAGSSKRAGFDKLMALFGGSTVLGASFRVFYECPLISEIVIVTNRERYQAVVPDVAVLEKPVRRVDGGAERHLSVMAGLNSLVTDMPLVAVHDGARPLLNPVQLLRCIEAARQYGAAASAHPMVDTLKRATVDGLSLPEQVDRSCLWAMETPQIFDRRLLDDAYRNVMEAGLLVTDEVSAMETIGRRSFLVRDEWPNPKITLPGDWEMATILWKQYGTPDE